MLELGGSPNRPKETIQKPRQYKKSLIFFLFLNIIRQKKFSTKEDKSFLCSKTYSRF